MKVPNSESAALPEAKLRDYLLSPSHPVGRYKARFFTGVGYSRDNFSQLAKDLRSVLCNEASNVVETDFGTKYIVPGVLDTPAGVATQVVTVWIILHGQSEPRFVTAYPGDGDEG